MPGSILIQERRRRSKKDSGASDGRRVSVGYGGMGTTVKLRENSFYLWIIVPSDNEHPAWSGSRWVPITSEGLPVGDLQALKNFATVEEAVSYAQSAGFEVEHG